MCAESQNRRRYAKELIEYDTKRADGGYYTLPKGDYLQLIFIGNLGIPFGIIRRNFSYRRLELIMTKTNSEPVFVEHTRNLIKKERKQTIKTISLHDEIINNSFSALKYNRVRANNAWGEGNYGNL